MLNVDANYWETRWLNGETGWDAGAITTPLQTYFDQLTDKSLRILIPGCGNAYEAEYLYKKGFLNTSVIDIAPAALKNFSLRCPEFPKSRLLLQDFFNHHGKYDLIVEQTFFCAIDPALRRQYAQQVYDLLLPEGKLVGLLFDDVLNNDHPPFGGSRTEYLGYFEPLFEVLEFNPCANSIKPRAGRELFIVLQRK